MQRAQLLNACEQYFDNLGADVREKIIKMIFLKKNVGQTAEIMCSLFQRTNDPVTTTNILSRNTNDPIEAAQTCVEIFSENAAPDIVFRSL